MDKVPGVYQIKNKINGKIYIGSSVNVQNRVSVHKMRLRNGVHSNPHLQNAWNKYGEESFEFSLLEEVKIKEIAVIREQWYLDNFNPDYNVVKKAEATNLGRKFSKDVRRKISISKKGTNVGKDNHFYGKHHSKETRRKLSQQHTGMKQSCETIKKKADALMGEKSHYAKLTWNKVRKIRSMYATGKYSQMDIVRVTGMSQSAINKIVRYKTWRE